MATLTDTDKRTLVLTRTVDAPAALVFKAWTHPQHLVRWWGPTDFTLPHCEQDFRVGGNYRFCMRAPDGSDHWVHGAYTEISEFDRLAFTWKREDEHGGIWCDNVVTITLEPIGSRTKLTLHHAVFATVDHCTEHGEGWDQCLDRFTEYANAMAAERSTKVTAEGHVEITRLFSAPRAMVWQMWTDPVHFAKWWGPKGSTGSVGRMDVRVGGRYHWGMHHPDGTAHWNAGEYVEVVPPEKLVFTDQASDPEGNMLPPPYEGMQKSLRITVILEDLGSSTRMIMRHDGLPTQDWRELAAAVWHEAFDKMQDNL